MINWATLSDREKVSELLWEFRNFDARMFPVEEQCCKWSGATPSQLLKIRLLRQDHTSQDHFCSVIDEFPVWNSEPDQTTMMSWATLLEREKVSDHLREVWNIDDRLLPLGLQTEELLSEWQKIAFFFD